MADLGAYSDDDAHHGSSNGDGQYAAEAGDFHAENALAYTCPACQQTFAVESVPENGLLTCPHCGADFFATTEMSDEDRAEARRMELEQQVRDERLVEMRRNTVLLERRSLYRTRTYFIIGMGLCIAWAMQLTFYVARRAIIDGEGLSLRVWLYLAAIVVVLFLSYLCLRRISAINAELAEPVQHEPTEPPDFSTLSDGSQVLDKAAKNLERLGGGPES
jgi:DNA-directed RNA polymerase subunit RPC12/RpoP/uncharacterized membrane protein YidH (DUF202 family)